MGSVVELAIGDKRNLRQKMSSQLVVFEGAFVEIVQATATSLSRPGGSSVHLLIIRALSCV